MYDDRGRVRIQWNWVAILSHAGSLVVSLAIWAGVIRMIEYLVR